MTQERIAKVIARAGLCSRRDAEKWIEAKRIRVNGKIITSPALNVSEEDEVLVDGVPLPTQERTRIWLYHKPPGLIVSHKDEKDRPTIFQYLPKDFPRVISVGRLDVNSEGLLLLTNDGELARYLELPATGWIRNYRVRVYGTITEVMLDKLKRGVTVDGVRYGSIDAKVETPGTNSWVKVSLKEGKNREIRKVFEHFNCKVSRLIRTSYGPFQLGPLPKGEAKEVTKPQLRASLGDWKSK